MVFLTSTNTTCHCAHSFSLWQSNIQHCQIHHKILQNYCDKISSFVKDSTYFIQKIKHLSINPEKETLVLFDISALFTSIPVPVALQVTNSKISTCTNFNQCLQYPYRKIHQCKCRLLKNSSRTHRIHQASGIHYHQLHLLLQ